MGEMGMDRTETTYVEAILRDELARGDRALRGVAPIISHMLQATGPALVSDAIVARLRGMLGDLAGQLLQAGSPRNAAEPDQVVEIDRLAEALSNDAALLDHLYALAMEGHLTDRLEARFGVDPVLSPLMQELVASGDAATAELAMSTLAAQSRFTQAQRRMGLPIGELPFDLFAGVLKQFKASVRSVEPTDVKGIIKDLKSSYDEGAGRLGLLARLTSSMRQGAIAGLDLKHSGLALFASALATLTRQSRELAIFSCHERQSARLALGLRAAGLGPEAIENQFLLLGQAETLPEGIDKMPADRALALLASSDTVEVAEGELA